jgi:hypothetical protein
MLSCPFSALPNWLPRIVRAVEGSDFLKAQLDFLALQNLKSCSPDLASFLHQNRQKDLEASPNLPNFCAFQAFSKWSPRSCASSGWCAKLSEAPSVVLILRPSEGRQATARVRLLSWLFKPSQYQPRSKFLKPMQILPTLCPS